MKENDLLHLVPFTSVFEYLFYLREISVAVRTLEKQALFYLAAAVSDFYIKLSDMVSHSNLLGSSMYMSAPNIF